MKTPAHHAKHLRVLGLLLGEIHPAAPKLLREAATQLEILDEITGSHPEIIDAAVQRLIDAGHPSLGRWPGAPKMASIFPNPSRN